LDNFFYRACNANSIQVFDGYSSLPYILFRKAPQYILLHKILTWLITNDFYFYIVIFKRLCLEIINKSVVTKKKKDNQ